jgi:ABC-2 type transport system ATP-binding protein
VRELRSAGPERLWVDVPAAAAGWAAGLPGARVLRTEGSRTLLELEPGGDDQVVLRAALDTGPVHEFRRDTPSLSELFRHVVSEDGEA